MVALESEVAVLSNKPKTSEAQDIKTEAAKAAIPDLKIMSINGYINSKGRLSRTNFAIDVLLDLRYLYQPSGEGPRRSNQLSISNEPLAKDDFKFAQRMVHSIRDLPERLRVNSGPVRSLLSSLSNSGLFAAGYPLVLQRPFKILIYYQESIKAHMAELKSILDQVVDSVPIENTGTDLFKSVAVLTPPLDDAIKNANKAKKASTQKPNSTKQAKSNFEQEARESILWTKEALVNL